MPKKIFVSIALSLVAIVLLAGGCTKQQNEAPPTTAQATAVVIKNAAFDPAIISVKKGTEVTWTNEDSVPHTVTAEGNFDSGTLSEGETFTYTFDEEGTFDYVCTIHPSMKGRIVVEE